MSEYKGFVDKLAGAVDEGMVEGKDMVWHTREARLEILIPEAYKRNQSQKEYQGIWKKFNELIEYGESKNIKVKFIDNLEKD